MADREHLLDMVSERAILGLLAAVAIYLILSGLIGPEWAWIIVRAGILFAILYGIISAVWTAVENHVHSAELRRRELLAKDREIDRMDRENERLRTITLESMGNFLNIDARTGKAEAHFRPVSPHRITVNQTGGPDAAGIGMDGPAQSPVPILANADHCLLFYGGRGRGKTVLVQNCLAAAGADSALILDPKPMEPGKWPPWARVVGSGYQYQDIDAAIRRLNENITRPAGRFLLVVDEINAINQNLPDFANHWTQALEVGREHGKAVWIVGQSKTAKGLGLQGSYDLLTNFDYLVGAKWKRSTDERWVEIEEEGEETLVCSPPPMFPGFGPGASGAGAGYPFQSGGGTTEADFVDAEFEEAGGAGDDDAPERDAKGRGHRSGTGNRIISGLLSYVKAPDGLTGKRAKIWRTLYREGEPMRAKDIEERTRLKGDFIRKSLREMEKAGVVKRPARGKYTAAL